MKKNLLKYYYIVALYLCSTLTLFAQALPDETDGDTTPAAPIDDYVWVAALVGLLFVFMWFRSVQNKRIKD